MILSASRRTDLPGYYSEWFMNRIREGYALYRNPMNHAQVCRVDLSVENIDGIVFWTKDPLPILEKLEELDRRGYTYYFQFTLTPYGLPYRQEKSCGTDIKSILYGKEIEPNLRDKQDILLTFQQLSDRLGQDRVLWRYDPIILSDTFPVEYHLQQFEYLCRKLTGYTKVCTISFVDLYSKINKRIKGQAVRAITTEDMHQLATELVQIAKPYHIELRACCEAVDLSADGIKPAACIDKEIFELIHGHSINARKDKSQRSGCCCVKSVDIGTYNTCRNGCIYCYANHSEASIAKNCLEHDPTSPMMIGTL